MRTALAKRSKYIRCKIFASGFRRTKIEFYLLDSAFEIGGQYFGVDKFRHHRKTIVGADVHTFVSGKPERHGVLNFTFGLLFAVNEKAACAAGGKLTGFIGSELIAHVNLSLWQLIARGDGVQFQTKKTISMLQSAFFDVKREAAKKTAFCDDHAGYSGPQPEDVTGPDYPNLR